MTSTNSRRPTELKLLSLLIAWLVLLNFLRFGQPLVFRQTLVHYPLKVSPLYLAISGAVWTITFSTLLWACWTRKPWAWGTMVGASSCYVVWALIDRFALQNSHGNELFFGITTLIVIIVVFILLFSRNMKDYYYDR